MSEPSNAAKSLRERIGAGTEDRFGRAVSELIESPLLAGAIGRAFDAREKATQAQEVALSALNIPSAADIERLTRRLRSVSHRLEGIEDGVDRLDRALSPSGVEARLSAIEAQLRTLTTKVEQAVSPAATATRRASPRRSGKGAAAPRKAATRGGAGKGTRAGRAAPKSSSRRAD